VQSLYQKNDILNIQDLSTKFNQDVIVWNHLTQLKFLMLIKSWGSSLCEFIFEFIIVGEEIQSTTNLQRKENCANVFWSSITSKLDQLESQTGFEEKYNKTFIRKTYFFENWMKDFIFA
jgi:hypothetical protein